MRQSKTDLFDGLRDLILVQNFKNFGRSAAADLAHHPVSLSVNDELFVAVARWHHWLGVHRHGWQWRALLSERRHVMNDTLLSFATPERRRRHGARPKGWQHLRRWTTLVPTSDDVRVGRRMTDVLNGTKMHENKGLLFLKEDYINEQASVTNMRRFFCQELRWASASPP